MKAELDYINIEPNSSSYSNRSIEVDFEPYYADEFINEAFENYGSGVKIDAMVSEHKDGLIEELCCYYEDDVLKKLDIDEIINFLENEGYKVEEE